jgi:hypothetical protein
MDGFGYRKEIKTRLVAQENVFARITLLSFGTH